MSCEAWGMGYEGWGMRDEGWGMRNNIYFTHKHQAS